jgi:phosphate transport system permease protein
MTEKRMKRPRTNDALIVDRTMTRIITAGGLLMIGTLVLMFGLIFAETLPLWKGGRADPEAKIPLGDGAAALAAGENEYREAGDLLLPSGVVRVIDLKSGRIRQELPFPGARGRAVTSASRSLRGDFVAGFDDGEIVFASALWKTSFTNDLRAVELSLSAGPRVSLDPEHRPSALVVGRVRESGLAVASSAPSRASLLYGWASEDEGSGAKDLSALLGGESVTTLAMDDRGDFLSVGTASGRILSFSLEDPKEPILASSAMAFPDPAPVTALRYLLGGQTLLAGDARGRIAGLQRAREAPGSEVRTLRAVHVFSPHDGPVTALAASPRGKSFVSADSGGGIQVQYSTTGRVVARASATEGIRSLAVAPKGDGFVALGSPGLSTFGLDAPHPDASLSALFAKLTYEGHDEPEYVWQSTGGTDDFEPKYSLVPLIFGTMKGTLYALVFAIPIAIAAAFYTSLFAHRTIRAVVKPTVELMAGLPSVVIGFIAGLWLSPFIERATTATLLSVPMVPIFVLTGVFLFQLVPFDLRKRMRAGSEIVLIVLLSAAAVWACFALGPVADRFLFGGDFKQWLFLKAGLRYDARNSIVIGFAMGFAVIPVIFTIAEDALSSVPEHLKAASLALGASAWQTAVRVVLPTASAGIFSAVMIGFGRAVGETMIVLMATGNTPIMGWSPFDGMRTLAANIAVEISEAPQGGTLYRVLFLGALLLFLMTFVVNTLAEVLRQRFRKKYSVI